MKTAERKMSYIAEVTAIREIPNADAIVSYEIDEGWSVVDKKDAYTVGDQVIYVMIDGWVPHSIAPFLSKGKEPREYNGVKGEKLRTIRLRGSLSQGLILPISVLGERVSRADRGLCDVFLKRDERNNIICGVNAELGADVSHFLNIQKWEPPPEFLNADSKGLFPSFLQKSDQTRIQNLWRDNRALFARLDILYEVTEKLEGQSLTAYFNNGQFGVCSRNLELKDSDNTFWNTARKYDLQAKLSSIGKNIAIQCEQCGPGISGNIYGMTEHKLYVYDIFDIDSQRYLSPDERNDMLAKLDLPHAPVVYQSHGGFSTLQEYLDFADGYSVLPFNKTLREGLVFKAYTTDRISFKVISNKYLERQK